MSTDDREPAWRLGERLHHLFEDRRRAVSAPGLRSVAVDLGESGVSFDELGRVGNALAVILSDSGVGPGTVVALLVDRSILSHAVVIALSRLGAAYVPLDVSFPADRMEFMCDDAGVEMVLTLDAHRPDDPRAYRSASRVGATSCGSPPSCTATGRATGCTRA